MEYWRFCNNEWKQRVDPWSMERFVRKNIKILQFCFKPHDKSRFREETRIMSSSCTTCGQDCSGCRKVFVDINAHELKRVNDQEETFQVLQSRSWKEYSTTQLLKCWWCSCCPVYQSKAGTHRKTNYNIPPLGSFTLTPALLGDFNAEILLAGQGFETLGGGVLEEWWQGAGLVDELPELHFRIWFDSAWLWQSVTYMPPTASNFTTVSLVWIQLLFCLARRQSLLLAWHGHAGLGFDISHLYWSSFNRRHISCMSEVCRIQRAPCFLRQFRFRCEEKLCSLPVTAISIWSWQLAQPRPWHISNEAGLNVCHK